MHASVHASIGRRVCKVGQVHFKSISSISSISWRCRVTGSRLRWHMLCDKRSPLASRRLAKPSATKLPPGQVDRARRSRNFDSEQGYKAKPTTFQHLSPFNLPFLIRFTFHFFVAIFTGTPPHESYESNFMVGDGRRHCSQCIPMKTLRTRGKLLQQDFLTCRTLPMHIIINHIPSNSADFV